MGFLDHAMFISSMVEGLVALAGYPGEHPFAHFLMRDGFAPIKRADSVLDAGDLHLVNI